MKKILMILLLTIVIILPTYATNWVQVGEKLYIDTDSIEPYVNDYGNIEPNRYSYWTKNLNDGSESWRKSEKFYNKKIWYYTFKEIIDINRKSISSKSFVIYDLKSNVIQISEQRDYNLEWQSIVPDSVGDLKLYLIKKVINEDSIKF